MSDAERRITQNLADISGRIAEAARRSGRAPESVRLVAVTKYVSAEQARMLVAAGCLDLGESRPQQLWRKAEQLAGAPIRWHQVGTLQRNKARRTVPLLWLLHSADSLRLLSTLDPIAAEAERRLPVLLEVNIAGDAAKHGFCPAELESVLPAAGELEHLEIRGLMTMASLAGGPDAARREFAALRQLRDRLDRVRPATVSLAELSMGMSGDFEQAIEEGATMVRVGSALFEGAGND